jgi:hypothetical protein
MVRLAGYTVGAVRRDGRSNAASVGVNGLKVRLRNLGVLTFKAIPEIYLRAHIADRMQLLRGLMDSDGHISKDRGRAIFGSTDSGLAHRVLELVASLGETATISDRLLKGYGKTVRCWRVEWKPTECPCALPRKSANFRPRKIAQYRGILKIERIESVPTRCISVDSETKSYLAGRSMIPTHNTVFRRLSKWLQMSPEVSDSISRIDETEYEFQSARRVKTVPSARTEPIDPLAMPELEGGAE